MVKVNVATLKSELSKYLDIAHNGEQVIVTSHGEEIAKIEPIQMVTSKKINWTDFMEKHPPIKPLKKGIPGSKLIRMIRDEE